jgi:hypothetical protein
MVYCYENDIDDAVSFEQYIHSLYEADKKRYAAMQFSPFMKLSYMEAHSRRKVEQLTRKYGCCILPDYPHLQMKTVKKIVCKLEDLESWEHMVNWYFDWFQDIRNNKDERRKLGCAFREIVSIIGAIQFIKIFDAKVAKGEIGYEAMVNEPYYDGAVSDDPKDNMDVFCMRLIYVFLYFIMNAYFTY